MLHSSSLHYYAYYYALLCLLHHQQQAATVTIIIDGATTNEWATRDEYQRLIDSSQNPSGPSGSATSSSNTAPVSVGAPEPAASGNAVNSLNGPRQASATMGPAQAAATGQPLASASSTPTGRSATPQQSFSNSQQQRETNDRQAATNLDDVQLALDRLDLIEHERREQVQQLNRLQMLEKTAESNVVFALTHGKTNAYTSNNNNNNNNDEDVGFGAGEASRSQYLNQQQQQQQQLGAHSEGQLAPVLPDNRQPSVAAGGARTISDLVPFTDDYLEDPLTRLKERDTPKIYCGKYLTDVLDLVCHGYYYDNAPQIVNPTVKTKRSIGYANSDIANDQLMMLDSSASSSSSSADAPGTLRDETNGLAGGSSSATGGQVSSPRTKLRPLTRGVTLGRPASHSNADSDGDRGDRSASFINNGESSLRANYDNGNNLDEPHNQQQQHYLSTIDIQNHNQNQNHNHNHYNNGGPNVRNRHSKMAQSRRRRGPTQDCCKRPCTPEELLPYCGKPRS